MGHERNPQLRAELKAPDLRGYRALWHCRELTAEFEEAERPVELDHDIKGETGLAAITDTIERKIRNCDVFVADLTPVTVQEPATGQPRIVPNPNVMYELGYACSSIGHDRVVAVLNTAFAGAARQSEGVLVEGTLPFNLRHRRFPECYELAEDTDTKDLREVRRRLVKSLTGKLRPFVEVAPEPVGAPYEPMRPIEGRTATFFCEGDVVVQDYPETKWRDMDAHVFVPAFPERAIDLTPHTLRKICDNSLREILPFSTGTGNFGLNEHGFVTCSITALPEDIFITRDLIQYFRSGEVWAIFGSFLARDGEYVPWVVEDIFAWSTSRIAVFSERSEMRGPGRLVFGLAGVKGRYFLRPGRHEEGRARAHGHMFHRDEFEFDCDIRSFG